MVNQGKRLSAPWVDGVDLRLAGFTCHNWYDGLQCILHGKLDVQEVFDRFVERLVAAIGQRYFPVYRMADGEFLFCLARQRHYIEQSTRLGRLAEAARDMQSRLHAFRGFGTLWGENYSFWETIRGRRKLPRLVREISRSGVLGLYFMRRGDCWGEQFILPMLDWFAAHGIELNQQNYLPFYMVYAALNGPSQKLIFSGRRLLVATHKTPERVQGITLGLRKIGVRSVEFLELSASKTMFQQIAPARLAEAPDLVLVGGGIGSANIIVQLRELSVPVIDAGSFLEYLIDPGRCDPRPFLGNRPVTNKACAAGVGDNLNP